MIGKKKSVRCENYECVKAILFVFFFPPISVLLSLGPQAARGFPLLNSEGNEKLNIYC